MSFAHRCVAHIALVASFLGTAGCSTTPVAPESKALYSAAGRFEEMASAALPISSAEATLTKARMLAAAYHGSIQPLMIDCWTHIDSLQKRYTTAAVAEASPAILDKEYKALLHSPPCGRVALPPTPPPPAQPLITDLRGYFDALQAIATAKDADSFDSAARALSDSVTKMAGAAGGPAVSQAVPSLFAHLAQTAVQQAEYDMLRRYVPQMDQLLVRAASRIRTELRVQQSFYLTVVTLDAHEGMKILNEVYKSAALRKNPAAALTVYAASAPIVDQFAAEQAAARIDPAGAFDALLAAHHELAKALMSNKGELSAIFNSAKSIGKSAKSLVSAANAKQ
jgi:hypothetical protein